MLATLRNAFKIKDLRGRIFFTIFMLVVVRLGCELPLPGINSESIASFFADKNGMDFFNQLTGGSFEKMSVFALNITPYITSSIIIQLLTIAIPKLEEMQKDGEDGRKKMTAITRYLTVGLAIVESAAMAIGFSRSGAIQSGTTPKWLVIVMMIAALTAGSAILMWIGERITEKGVGNGISIVLTINILSRLPQDFGTLWTSKVANRTVAKGVLALIIIIAIIAAMVLFVVLLQGAERRIPVQYSKKMQGRSQMTSGQQTHIPLKVNTSGVIPVIFAQSLMQTPVILTSLFTSGQGLSGFWGKFMAGLNQGNWFKTATPEYSWGAILYILLIIAFAFFYTQITFNPLEVANNMKKSGGFIPGIRPGKPTSDYLTSILNHIVFIGAVGLLIVAIFPIVCNGLFNADVSFGGTSIIIIVGVIIETLKQIESHMRVRNYKGFLND